MADDAQTGDPHTPDGFYGVVIHPGDVELVVLDRRPTPSAALNQARNRCGPDDTYSVVSAPDKAAARAHAGANRVRGYY